MDRITQTGGEIAVFRDEFDKLTDRLKGNVKFLYFHLMGEPFFHPDLGKFIFLAHDAGLKVILTTNGTLLEKHGDGLINIGVEHHKGTSIVKEAYQLLENEKNGIMFGKTVD